MAKKSATKIPNRLTAPYHKFVEEDWLTKEFLNYIQNTIIRLANTLSEVGRTMGIGADIVLDTVEILQVTLLENGVQIPSAAPKNLMRFRQELNSSIKQLGNTNENTKQKNMPSSGNETEETFSGYLNKLPSLVKKIIKDQNQIYEELLLRMILCRGIDNYLTYVSELLTLIFRTRPETLRSRETITFETVLEHDNMDELILFLVEKRVNDLAYQGIYEINKDISNKLNFSLFDKDSQELERAVQIVSTRNIIVHNRGMVNDRFLKDVRSSTLNIGEQIQLTSKSIYDDLTFLAHSATDIDIRATAKFNLPVLAKGNDEQS